MINDGKWLRLLQKQEVDIEHNAYKGIIPKIILRLHPTLTQYEYNNVKQSPMFLKNNAYVCESCFLLVTRHA